MDYLDTFDLDSENVELETGIRGVCAYVYGSGLGKFNNLLPSLSSFIPYAWDRNLIPSCIKEDTYAVHHWAGILGNNKVSIIIPCYKQEEYLNDAIDSALNQTVKPLEVIVVFDGSPTIDNWVNKYSAKDVKVIVTLIVEFQQRVTWHCCSKGKIYF